MQDEFLVNPQFVFNESKLNGLLMDLPSLVFKNITFSVCSQDFFRFRTPDCFGTQILQLFLPICLRYLC